MRFDVDVAVGIMRSLPYEPKIGIKARILLAPVLPMVGVLSRNSVV